MQRGQGSFYFPTMNGMGSHPEPWEAADPWQGGALTLGGAPVMVFPSIQQQQQPLHPAHQQMQSSSTGEAVEQQWCEWWRDPSGGARRLPQQRGLLYARGEAMAGFPGHKATLEDAHEEIYTV
eukprot:2277507-Pyramimonas_sp.AAC.1